MISGKKVILWMIAILAVFSIVFLTANAMLVRQKADVCAGYYDATARWSRRLGQEVSSSALAVRGEDTAGATSR